MRKWLKRLAFACAFWIVLSFVTFAVSAQIQSDKLSGDVAAILGAGPFMFASPQTILVIGTDARPPNTHEPGQQSSLRCWEQEASGQSPHGGCATHGADTLMLIRAGGGVFRKLSMSYDDLATIPGYGEMKLDASYSLGGAKLTVETVEGFLHVHVDHVAIVDFLGFENFINAIGGVNVNVPERVCSEISGGYRNGGVTLNLSKGDHTLNGVEALAYARTRVNSCDPAYDDVNRGVAQQGVINAIKDRLTEPLRLPYNFIMGPIIGWDAPQAFVSDMGFFSMPQLVFSAAIGGGSGPNVLRPAEVGIYGGLVISESERQRAVRQLLDG